MTTSHQPKCSSIGQCGGASSRHPPLPHPPATHHYPTPHPTHAPAKVDQREWRLQYISLSDGAWRGLMGVWGGACAYTHLGGGGGTFTHIRGGHVHTHQGSRMPRTGDGGVRAHLLKGLWRRWAPKQSHDCVERACAQQPAGVLAEARGKGAGQQHVVRPDAQVGQAAAPACTRLVAACCAVVRCGVEWCGVVRCGEVRCQVV